MGSTRKKQRYVPNPALRAYPFIRLSFWVYFIFSRSTPLTASDRAHRTRLGEEEAGQETGIGGMVF